MICTTDLSPTSDGQRPPKHSRTFSTTFWGRAAQNRGWDQRFSRKASPVPRKRRGFLPPGLRCPPLSALAVTAIGPLTYTARMRHARWNRPPLPTPHPMKCPSGPRVVRFAGRRWLSLSALTAFALWTGTSASSGQTIAPRKFAGGYQACTWGDRDGLPQNTVLATVGTPDGYLWFATYEGMARFDGVRFVVFDAANTPALQGHTIINTLAPDGAGGLWVGSDGGGLCRWQDGNPQIARIFPGSFPAAQSKPCGRTPRAICGSGRPQARAGCTRGN